MLERGEIASNLDKIATLIDVYGYSWEKFISHYAEYLQDQDANQANLKPPITVELPEESGQTLILQSGDINIVISVTSKS